MRGPRRSGAAARGQRVHTRRGRKGWDKGGWGQAYLGDGLLDARLAVGEVEREDLACVDHERDDARGDEDRDEERRDGVEARPTVVLDQQRRHDHAHRAERVLSGASGQRSEITCVTCEGGEGRGDAPP